MKDLVRRILLPVEDDPDNEYDPTYVVSTGSGSLLSLEQGGEYVDLTADEARELVEVIKEWLRG